MGLVNTVVPLGRARGGDGRVVPRDAAASPIALRMLKASMNAADDGLAGIQQLAGDATLLFYMSEEAQEGRDAYVEKRRPDFAQFPKPAVARRSVTREQVGRRGSARGRCRRRSCRCSSGRRAPPARAGDHLVAGGRARCVVSLAIQVGTNYANDYSDGVRGTDDATRVGPVRLVGVGLASPAAVKRGRAASRSRWPRSPGSRWPSPSGPWLLLVGAAAFAAGWFYTGGPEALRLRGFGELFVFVFFGLVATVGLDVRADRADHRAGRGRGDRRSGSSPPRCSSSTTCATSRPTRSRGKRTLAVRLGDHRTRLLYVC